MSQSGFNLIDIMILDHIYISVYVSMPEEVCTRAIITSILETKKSLFVPYFNKEEMVMVKIKDLEDYKSLPVDTYGVR